MNGALSDTRDNNGLAQRLVSHVYSLALSMRREPAKTGWIALGFVAGMLFWHAIGFWTFMNRVVFDGSETAAVSTAHPPAGPSAYANIETGSLARIEKLASRGSIEAACTALIRDPIQGTTHQAPCPRLAKPLRRHTTSSRGDLGIRKPIQAVTSPEPPLDWTTFLAPLKDAKLQIP